MFLKYFYLTSIKSCIYQTYLNINRQLYQYKAHIQWYNFEFIPAVILVQSSVRRYKAIQFVNDLKLKLKAARLMQLCYLNFKKVFQFLYI